MLDTFPITHLHANVPFLQPILAVDSNVDAKDELVFGTQVSI